MWLVNSQLGRSGSQSRANIKSGFHNEKGTDKAYGLSFKGQLCSKLIWRLSGLINSRLHLIKAKIRGSQQWKDKNGRKCMKSKCYRDGQVRSNSHFFFLPYGLVERHSIPENPPVTGLQSVVWSKRMVMEKMGGKANGLAWEAPKSPCFVNITKHNFIWTCVDKYTLIQRLVMCDNGKQNLIRAHICNIEYKNIPRTGDVNTIVIGN